LSRSRENVHMIKSKPLATFGTVQTVLTEQRSISVGQVKRMHVAPNCRTDLNPGRFGRPADRREPDAPILS
jgi:hypothetical protein